MKHIQEIRTIVVTAVILQFGAAGAIGQMIGPNFVFPPCSKLEYNPAVAAQGNLCRWMRMFLKKLAACSGTKQQKACPTRALS